MHALWNILRQYPRSRYRLDSTPETSEICCVAVARGGDKLQRENARQLFTIDRRVSRFIARMQDSWEPSCTRGSSTKRVQDSEPTIYYRLRQLVTHAHVDEYKLRNVSRTRAWLTGVRVYIKVYNIIVCVYTNAEISLWDTSLRVCRLILPSPLFFFLPLLASSPPPSLPPPPPRPLFLRTYAVSWVIFAKEES